MNLRILLALTLTAWLGLSSAESATLAASTVQLRDVDLSYQAEGVVEAAKQATVAAQVQGRVVEVRVDAGDHVKQGDVLMRIDERQASQGVAGADAQVAQSQANLANARATYERTKNLFRQKFVSQAALDQAVAAYRSAEAQVKVDRATRGQASTTKSFTSIASPLTGVVAQRHTELGEMASPGKALVTVYEPGQLRVVASVPQYKLAQVQKAQRAKVEFAETQRWIDAGSITVLPTADARTHTVQVRVNLPEKVSDVAPGMFARVHLTTGRAKKLLLPAQAVLRRGEITAVYILDDGGKPQLRQVRLGEALADGLVEILAGAAAGERVATDPVKAGIFLKQAADKR